MYIGESLDNINVPAIWPKMYNTFQQHFSAVSRLSNDYSLTSADLDTQLKLYYLQMRTANDHPHYVS